MHAADHYEEMIREFRRLIETNLPTALESAGIPEADRRSVIDRVLRRLPSSPTASDGRGLDAALVIGLGLLEAPRRDARSARVAPVSEEARRSFTQLAFSDYVWTEEDYLDAEFDDLVESFDLVLVTKSIGTDRPIGIVTLSHQIDVFRQTVKSPLVTRTRAYAAYRAAQGGPSRSGRRTDVTA